MATKKGKSGALRGKKQPATVAEEVETAMNGGDANVDTAADGGNAPAAGADNAPAAAGPGPEPAANPAPAGGGEGPPAAETGGQVQGAADAAQDAPDAGAAEEKKAPIVAVIERIGQWDSSMIRVDLIGGYCFVVPLKKLPPPADEPLPEDPAIQISSDGQAIGFNNLAGYPGGLVVSLSKLKAAWEAENGGELFPELKWLVDEPSLEWPIDAQGTVEFTPRPNPTLGAVPIDDLFPGWEENVARAYCIAGIAGAQFMDPEADRPMAAVAANHVRAQPDAPAEAIPIELRLKGFRDVPQGGLRVMAAWRVFVFTLKELDRLDAEEKALAAAEAKAAEPVKPPVARPGQMAFEPSKPPLSPTGFSARR